MAKFKDKLKFSDEIESIARTKGIPVMEAVVWYCEETDLEIESAVKKLTPDIKKRIESEARGLNLLKREESELPL